MTSMILTLIIARGFLAKKILRSKRKIVMELLESKQTRKKNGIFLPSAKLNLLKYQGETESIRLGWIRRPI